MISIFISYRRDDSADVSGRIRDRLVERFGPNAVFTDVDSIPLGIDFKRHIDGWVSRCECFLPVIGPSWLDASGVDGRRRLDDPNDFVRMEIEAALARGIPVIPLLVRKASMPKADQLPETLRPIASRNGLLIRPDPDFHTDMDRLIKSIISHSQPSPWPSRLVGWLLSPRKALTAVGGVLAVLIGVLWLLPSMMGDPPSPTTPERELVQPSPDWSTAAAEMRTVGGIDYYEVDFTQGLTANLVCSLVRKVPGQFTTDAKVCQAFHPDARVKNASSGDPAVVYCTGQEEGICSAHKDVCLVCPNCTSGVKPGQWGGSLYGKMYTTCREPG